MNNYTSLIDKYSKKLEQDSSSRVFAPLGEIYRKLDMYDKAIEVLEDGLKANPNYHLGIISLAQCLYDVKEYQRAYGVMKPYYRFHTDNIKYLKVFAQICVKLNFIEEALNAYKTVLFLNPRDMDAMEFIENNEDEHHEALKADSGITHFNVDELEDDVEAWSQLSLVDRDEEAKEELPVSHTININKIDTTPVFSHTLVDLYIKQGAKEKAIDLLERALEVNPNDDEIITRLNSLRVPKNSGHDDLMAAFDNRAGQIYNKNEDYLEKVTMAFDLFLHQLKNKQQTQSLR